MPNLNLMFMCRCLSVLAILILSACGGESGLQSTDTSQVQEPDKTVKGITVNPNMTALFLQRTSTSISAKSTPRSTLVDGDYYSGTLLVTNAETGNQQEFYWYIRVDADGKAVSQKNISLVPGTYHFSLLLEGNGHQYAGSAENILLEDGDEQAVNMTIKPLIGNTISDVQLLDTMADIKLRIDQADLLAIDLTEPRIGISIDGADEEIFSVNSETGLSDAVLSLPDGEYRIQVNFYDGNMLIGHTLDTQETVQLVNSENISFDIVPLQADVSLALSEGNPDTGLFRINIPNAIVDSVDALETLKAYLKLNGSVFVEQLLDIQQEGGQYFAATTLDIGLENQDQLVINLDFIDQSKAEEDQLLTSCTGVINLQSTNNQFTCPLELQNSYVVSGHLLATLAINVLQSNDGKLDSVAGAEVFINGESIGLTNGSVLSTPGFIKTNVQQGEYSIRVEAGSRATNVQLTALPLQIINQDIILSPSDTDGGDDSDGSSGNDDGIVIVDGPGCGSESPRNSHERWIQIAAQTSPSQLSTCVNQRSYTRLLNDDVQFMVAYPDLGIHYVFDLWYLRRANQMNCAYLPETLPNFLTPDLFWKQDGCSYNGATSFSLTTATGNWCQTTAYQAPAVSGAGINYNTMTANSRCNLYIRTYNDTQATLLPANGSYYTDEAYAQSYDATNRTMLVDDQWVSLNAIATTMGDWGYVFDGNVKTVVTSAYNNPNVKSISINYHTPLKIRRFEIVNPFSAGVFGRAPYLVRVQARVPGRESIWTTIGAYSMPQTEDLNVMLTIPDNDYGRLSEYRLIFVRPYNSTNPRDYIQFSDIKAYTYD